jgi:putative addiction module component (TIGR02574 family)
MTKDAAASVIEGLSVAERLALLEAICESLAQGEAELPLSPQQRELIRRRLEAYRADPKPGIPAAQAVADRRPVSE